MNIDDLTLGQFKEIEKLFSNRESSESGLNSLVGKKVIVRTYSAGVFFGKLIEKSGSEVIIADARRLYYWKTTNAGISLSEVAISGLHSDSKVCAPTSSHWLQAVELIPCSLESIKSIEGQDDYKA